MPKNANSNLIRLFILVFVFIILSIKANADTSSSNKLTPPASEPSLIKTNKSVHEVTLDSLRDTSISLNEIRQQTIYIFLEATRTHYQAGSKDKIAIPKLISLQSFDSNKNYMSPRPEWLWYYVGNMEPIIQLFQADVNDVAAGVKKLIVPEGTRDSLRPLWKKWLTELSSLNEHLTKLNDLINSKPDINNKAVAEEAVEMFKVTDKLEITRQQAFKIIQKVKHLPCSTKTEL